MRRFIVFILSLLPISLVAQLNYSFTHYSSEDGLSQNTVMCILEDSKGFMWFSTWDGINKFDGYTFKTYRATNDNQVSFTNNRADFLCEDALGYIWVLTYDNRAHRLDPRTETFIQVPATAPESLQNIRLITTLDNGVVWLITDNNGAMRIEDAGNGVTSQWYRLGGVNQVFLDDQNNEWILTNSGLYCLKPESSEPLSFFTSGEQSNRQQSFIDHLESENFIWFGAGQGRLWKYNKKDEFFEMKELAIESDIHTVERLDENELLLATRREGFLIYTISNGNTVHYQVATSPEMRGNRIENIYIDRHREIWLNLADVDGVVHFNPYKRQFRHETPVKEKGNAERSEPNFHIHEDVNGYLWVHPYGGGFSLYDRAADRLRPFFNEPGADDWRFSNKVHGVFSDREGNLWMSTHSKGLEKISFFRTAFHFEPLEKLSYESLTNDTRCLYEDDKGRVWVGTKDGKIRIYETNNRYIGLLTADGAISKTGVPAAGVAYHIMQDSAGNFWISTKGEGLLLAKPEGDKFRLTHFKHNPDDPYSLSDNNVYNTHEDVLGRIWIATFGGGLNYIPAHESNIRFIHHKNEMQGWPIDYCYRVRVVNSDANGNIWVGTTSGAVSFPVDFKSPGKIAFQRHYRLKGEDGSLSNNDVYSIVNHSDKHLYLATFGGGLNQLVRTTPEGKGVFRAFTTRDGLPSDVLLSLQQDKSGNLWMGTENGLSKFNPAEGAFENYDEKQFNFRATFNEASATVLAAGKMIFGTSTGLLRFSPDSIQKSEFVPPVVFTRLLLANEEVHPGDKSLLKFIPDETEEIRLSPKQNIFTIQYASLDMKAPEKIQYAYKLDGFEREWNYSDKQCSVTYTNLPKGSYLFEVRSTNNEGVWVENTRGLRITVLPTFWETPWGYLTFVLLLFMIILVAVLILFTIYRLKHEVRVEQQISDIKLRFFTNISHELRTPLTLIAGPVEQVLKNQSLSPETKDQLRLVERNTNRMLRLINQILDFRKIQNNKMKMKVQQVDLVLFVRRVMDNFESLAEMHRIRFILESEQKTLMLWLDVDKLEKIVFNLVSNAFKYTPQDKMIKVFIREEEDNVLLGVQDEGIGIAESRKESVFLRFENLMDKNLFDHSSTGIGLSLVKELVEMHKGRIKVDSRLGEGSTFLVTFKKGKEHFDDATEFILTDLFSDFTPQSRPTDDYISSEPVVDQISAEKAEAVDSMLIIEDNAELRHFLRSIFKASYRIIEAADGDEGLAKAREFVPDIIISDVMMPGKSGIEMIKDIREQMETSHIPVILLTAKSGIESKLEGLGYGADDYITKPFSSTYLEARVLNLLIQRKKLQDIYRSGLMTVEPEQHIQRDRTIENAEPEKPEMSKNDRKFMDKILSLMEENMDNGDLIVDDFVKELAVSRSVFFKKLKALTGLAPVEFIKEMRIKRAAGLIEENELTMTQISYMVGINDSRYFSKCFKQIYGMTPTEYKEQKLHQSGQ